MPTDAEGLPDEYYASRTPSIHRRDIEIATLKQRVKRLEDQMADLANRLNGTMRRGYPWDD